MVVEWLSSWLAEQEDRGSIPGLATWIFRDWFSPASKSRYGWKIAKSTLILKTTQQPLSLERKPDGSGHTMGASILWHLTFKNLKFWPSCHQSVYCRVRRTVYGSWVTYRTVTEPSPSSCSVRCTNNTGKVRSKPWWGSSIPASWIRQKRSVYL